MTVVYVFNLVPWVHFMRETFAFRLFKNHFNRVLIMELSRASDFFLFLLAPLPLVYVGNYELTDTKENANASS